VLLFPFRARFYRLLVGLLEVFSIVLAHQHPLADAFYRAPQTPALPVQ
jgi:hypothetical protein